MKKTEFPSIGGYEIIEEINRGGFGVVYKARDIKNERVVAIKIFEPSTSSTNVTKRIKKLDKGELAFDEAISLQGIQGLFEESFPIFYGLLVERKLEREEGLQEISELILDNNLNKKIKRKILIVDEESFPKPIYTTTPVGNGSLVMEFIEGQNLREFITDYGGGKKHLYLFKKKLYLRRFITDPTPSIDELIRLVEKTIRPVCVLHTLGYVHGDIKPDNFIVTKDNKIKLIDFTYTNYLTLARSTGAREYKIEGEIPSFRSDIFSLGITLYELITGEHPFPNVTKQKRIELMKQFRNYYPPKKPTEIINKNICLDEVIGGLDNIILKCINPDPKRRYMDAAELMADIAPEGLIEVADRLRESTKYKEALNLLSKLKECDNEYLMSKKIAMELRIKHYLGEKVSILNVPLQYRNSVAVFDRVARLFRDKGDITLAIEFAERMRDSYKQTKSKAISKAILYYTFGTISSLAGNFKEAVNELKESIYLRQQKSSNSEKDTQGIPYCYKELAQIELWKSNYKEATKNLTRALYWFKRNEQKGKIDKRAKSYIYIVKSRIELEQGNYQKARESLETAQSLVVDLKRGNDLCNLQRGFYYLKTGEINKAKDVFIRLRNSDIGQVKVESLVGLYHITKDEAVKEEARTFCKNNGLGYYLGVVDRLS